MPTYLTATDIDNLARRGKRSLALRPDDRLTPLARDRARELGMELRLASTGPDVPPGYTWPRADEAHAAFLQALRDYRKALAPAPMLANLLDAVIQAAEDGPAVMLPKHLQLAAHGFSWTKRRALLDPLRILIIWAHRLYGPRTLHRRYDILWALAEIQRCLSKPS